MEIHPQDGPERQREAKQGDELELKKYGENSSLTPYNRRGCGALKKQCVSDSSLFLGERHKTRKHPEYEDGAQLEYSAHEYESSHRETYEG